MHALSDLLACVQPWNCPDKAHAFAALPVILISQRMSSSCPPVVDPSMSTRDCTGARVGVNLRALSRPLLLRHQLGLQLREPACLGG